MIFMKRNIGSGDVLWHVPTMTPITIDSWSVGTGCVYGKWSNGEQIRLNGVETDLSWHRPFKSKRSAA